MRVIRHRDYPGVSDSWSLLVCLQSHSVLKVLTLDRGLLVGVTLRTYPSVSGILPFVTSPLPGMGGLGIQKVLTREIRDPRWFISLILFPVV